jgi:hypothetical protein
MIRKSVVVLSLAAATASAQKADAIESAKKIWGGVWEGPAWHLGESDPIGGIRLEIGRDSIWKVNLDVITAQTMSAVNTDFTPDGNRATWMSAMMGNACKTVAVIEGTKLKGEAKCGDHGGLAFELKRRQ